MESRSVFVIRRKSECHRPDNNYSTFGTTGGVKDAIGYGELIDARKFLSREEAEAYIEHELPEWAKALHCPVEVQAYELFFTMPELSILLRHSEEEIPPHLLEPAKGRLLIWRR